MQDKDTLKWKTCSEEEQKYRLDRKEVVYRAWKAWEIVLWPTQHFKKHWYRWCHYAAVGTGIALGWTGLSLYLTLVWRDDEAAWTCCGYDNIRIVPRVFVTFCLAVSVVCAVIFTLMGKYMKYWPRTRTLFEGISLLTVDLAIIFAALYGNEVL